MGFGGLLCCVLLGYCPLGCFVFVVYCLDSVWFRACLLLCNLVKVVVIYVLQY